MPDRYAFTSPFGRGSDPWFRIGNLDVTTTVAATIAAIFGTLWWAIEPIPKTWFEKLYLLPDSVISGQVWQIVSWPMANTLFRQQAIWTPVAIVIFYILGSRLEQEFGKRNYLVFLSLLTIIPAVLTTALGSLDVMEFAFLGGISFLEIGIFIAFVSNKPDAPFFYGIPGWILAVAFITIRILSFYGERRYDKIILTLIMVATAIVLTRSFDHAAPQLRWVPALPLKDIGSRKSKKKTRKQNRHLYSVSSVEDELELNALLDKVSTDGFENLSRSEQRRLKALSKKKGS